MTKEKFREIAGMAVGEASMCWSETPKGVFDSTRASKIVEALCSCFDTVSNRLERSERAKESIFKALQAARASSKHSKRLPRTTATMAPKVSSES